MTEQEMSTAEREAFFRAAREAEARGGGITAVKGHMWRAGCAYSKQEVVGDPVVRVALALLGPSWNKNDSSEENALAWIDACERAAKALAAAPSLPVVSGETHGRFDDGMVSIVLDRETYRVPPYATGQFLLSLLPLPRARLRDWQVWQEKYGQDAEDVEAGWDRPLGLKGGERFYSTPKHIG